MALILSLETATPMCSVALHKDGELLACFNIYSQKAHSSIITLLIENIIRQCNYDLKDIDAVAVSKGPGSFTGLRIGVATAKGLCFALEKPLIAVNTLFAMAAQVISYQAGFANQLYCPMIDARRMEVYCAVYDKNLSATLKTAAVIIDENSFQEVLQKNKLILIGSGAQKSFDVLKSNPNASFISGVHPSAEWMGKLAEEAYKNKFFEDIAYFEPFYLKDFVSNSKGK